MKKKILFSLCLILVISLPGCRLNFRNNTAAPTPPQPLPTADEVTEISGEPESSVGSLNWPYKNNKYHYELQYPLEEWLLNKSHPDKVEINYGTTGDDSTDWPAQVIITVAASDAKDIQTLTKSANYKNRYLSDELINGQTFAQLATTGAKGQGLEYLALWEKNLYTISLYPYPAKTGYEEDDVKINSQMDQILRSFKLSE